MADPTPTYDQVVAATMAALATNGSATVLHFENRKRSELELLREYQSQAGPSYEVELVLVDVDVDSVEGKCFGEKYSIYKVKLRHLYTRQDEEEISRIAKFRAEKLRGLLEGNANVFRIGGQVPLRTPEVVAMRGEFVERDDSRYYESILTFEVEGRRWS